MLRAEKRASRSLPMRLLADSAVKAAVLRCVRSQMFLVASMENRCVDIGLFQEGSSKEGQLSFLATGILDMEVRG